jgi:hypothetical protein
MSIVIWWFLLSWNWAWFLIAFAAFVGLVWVADVIVDLVERIWRQ